VIEEESDDDGDGGSSSDGIDYIQNLPAYAKEAEN